MKVGFWSAWAAASLLLAVPVQAAGFDDHYVAYYGDANGDRRTDVYLKWEAESDDVPSDEASTDEPAAPDIPNTLLTQTAQGGFVVDSGGVSDARLARWRKLPSPIVVAIIDFNMDGYMDVGLRFLDRASTIFPDGMHDQIVYAPEGKGEAPTLVKVIDAGTLKFFRELFGWMTDAEYFAAKPEGSAFDPRALRAATLLENVVAGKERITAGEPLEDEVKALVGDVLGVPVYGGIFKQGQPEYEDHHGFVIDRYRALLEVAAQLGSVAENK